MEERAVIAKSFPQWKVLVVALGLIPFNRGPYRQRFASGRMISSPTVGRDVLAGTIHWNAFRNQDVATPHQSAYGRRLPPGGSREGICGTFCNSPYLVYYPTWVGPL